MTRQTRRPRSPRASSAKSVERRLVLACPRAPALAARARPSSSPELLRERLDAAPSATTKRAPVLRARRRRSRTSGWTAAYMFDGSVHGVVVHTRSESVAAGRPARERERDVDARVVDRLVPLPDLARAERRAALRPPPDDLVPLVEEALLVELAERPPDALDVRAVVGDVRVAAGRPRRRRARSAPPTPSCTGRPTRCTS